MVSFDGFKDFLKKKAFNHELDNGRLSLKVVSFVFPQIYLSRSRFSHRSGGVYPQFPFSSMARSEMGPSPFLQSTILAGKSQLKNSEFNLKIGSFANQVQLGVLTKDIQKPGEKVTAGDAKKLSLALALLADGRSSSADSGGAAGSVHRSLGDHRSLCQKTSEQFNWFNWV